MRSIKALEIKNSMVFANSTIFLNKQMFDVSWNLENIFVLLLNQIITFYFF